MVELWISLTYGGVQLDVKFWSTFLCWNGEIHKSIIAMYDSYTDLYIWLITHHTASAVHDSGFVVHYALIMI